jgi:hypothetical protein
MHGAALALCVTDTAACRTGATNLRKSAATLPPQRLSLPDPRHAAMLRWAVLYFCGYAVLSSLGHYKGVYLSSQ